MKILFLGTQITVGGAQRVLLDQAGWFYQQGHSVTAAFFYDKDGLRAAWNEEHPFSVVEFGGRAPGLGKLANGRRFVRAVWRLTRWMRRERFDVIETFTPDSNLIGLPLAWLAGIPARIASHHGYIEGASRWRARLHGVLMNSPAAWRVVAVSERVRRMAVEEEGIRPEKTEVILNGIRPAPVNEPRTAARAALEKRKSSWREITPRAARYLTNEPPVLA